MNPGCRISFRSRAFAMKISWWKIRYPVYVHSDASKKTRPLIPCLHFLLSHRQSQSCPPGCFALFSLQLSTFIGNAASHPIFNSSNKIIRRYQTEFAANSANSLFVALRGFAPVSGASMIFIFFILFCRLMMMLTVRSLF